MPAPLPGSLYQLVLPSHWGVPNPENFHSSFFHEVPQGTKYTLYLLTSSELLSSGNAYPS